MKRQLNYFLFFLISCLSIFAADQLAKISFFENTGGLNSKASPITVKNNEATDLLNVDLDTDGAIVKRSGYTKLNTTAIDTDDVDGLYTYITNANTRYLIAACNGIYKMDDLDGTWDNITGATAITANTKARFTTFENSLIFTNGTDYVQYWAGTSTCSNLDSYADISITKAKYCTTFSNRLWLANVTVNTTAYPNRVYYSDIGDKDGWSGGYISIGYDDGDEITGIVELGGYLYVFKRKFIYKITATGDSTTPFTVEKTNATEGSIAPDSIQIINTGLMIFLSQQGITLFDGDVTEVIGYKISPTITSLAGTNLINASSVIYRKLNQYWLCVTDGDSGDKIVIWDYYHQAFLLHDGIHAKSITTTIDSAETERLYFGDYNGLVYRANYGTDDYPAGTATAINAYYVTKHYDFGYLYLDKVPKHLVLVYKYSESPSTLNVSYTYDLQTTDFVTESVAMQNTFSPIWDIAEWDIDSFGGTGATYKRIDLRSSGSTMRLKFSNNTLGETFSIYGWEIAYTGGRVVEN